jgi:hypothetical protein
MWREAVGCIGAFGKNLASVVVKMSSHFNLVYRTFLILYFQLNLRTYCYDELCYFSTQKRFVPGSYASYTSSSESTSLMKVLMIKYSCKIPSLCPRCFGGCLPHVHSVLRNSVQRQAVTSAREYGRLKLALEPNHHTITFCHCILIITSLCKGTLFM